MIIYCCSEAHVKENYYRYQIYSICLSGIFHPQFHSELGNQVPNYNSLNPSTDQYYFFWKKHKEW